MNLKWTPVLVLALLVACAPRAGTMLLPASRPDALALPAATSSPHAACTIVSGLASPIAGSPVVATAFGQLMISGTTRYAYPGVDFTYAAGKRINAAFAGTATYYPNLAGFGHAVIIRNTAGAQVLYAHFYRVTLTLSSKNTAKVKAGQEIAASGKTNLTFEYAPAGQIVKTGTQSNPCGSSNGATGSIGVMPASVAVYARFHSLMLNGVPVSPGPYPSGNPDVPTPATIAATNATVPAVAAANVYERSDVFSNYYVVLCGNAVFATGPARYAGPFTYAQSQTQVVLAVPSPLPKIVFFRDPGSQGASLTQALPAPYAQACPAPPPANVYVFADPTFYWIGQTEFIYYTANGGQTNDTVTFTSSSPSVVTASPSPLAVFPTAPPTWPPPTPHADLTATGVGTSTITVFDSSCNCDDNSISVTVAATPSPAPVPSPLPN